MMSAPALKELPAPIATTTTAYRVKPGSVSSSLHTRAIWVPLSGTRELLVDESQALSGSEALATAVATNENGLPERVNRLTAIHELAPGVRLKSPLLASIEELPDYVTA